MFVGGNVRGIKPLSVGLEASGRMVAEPIAIKAGLGALGGKNSAWPHQS